MGAVYVLELEGGRYYIGFTKYLQLRLQQHFGGMGAEFTKKYKPIRVVEVFHNVRQAKEHTVTKSYIRKYGIVKVRGGDWVGCTPNSYCPWYYLPKKRKRRSDYGQKRVSRASR